MNDRGVLDSYPDWLDGSDAEVRERGPGWWLVPIFCVTAVISGRVWPEALLVGLLGVVTVKVVWNALSGLLGRLFQALEAYHY